MKRIVVIALSLIFSFSIFAQVKNLKGDGQIFWEENFDWENPDDPKGWTAPEGWFVEDNSSDDNGFVWVWTKDSMQGPFAHRDGGYIINSSTRENGFLSIDLDNLNAYVDYMEMLFVNSTITLPIMDFSEHPSVLIGFEQMFKYFNSPRMVLEVSNDNGAHWATFDLKMGTSSMTNVLNLPNDEVAHYNANLTDVAGGQPEVTITITWEGSMLYFWMLDDIFLYEGWDYDLKMNHWEIQLVDENAEDAPGFYYMMPKSQIIPLGGFQASVINYGDYEINNIHLNVAINKNHIEQFNANSEFISYKDVGDPADTLLIEENYTPVDFGHYEISFSMMGDEEDQAPENNSQSYYFHVTDSVFARTPDISEANESPWKNYYYYTHEGDIMGVEFNPIEDCTASSISVFISRSNMYVDFMFVLYEITAGEGDDLEMIELISSEMTWVDSLVLEQGWVTLPLDPDGIGEFMKAGKRYIAGVQFWTYIEEADLADRGDTFWLGSTQDYPDSYDKQWWYGSYDGLWTQGSNNSKMIRLNIDNHENIIDGVPNSLNLSSLSQNYPNPFNTSTQIDYTLANEEAVLIEIKDISGRIVQSLDEGYKSAGKHSAIFSRSDLDAGLYFYTLKAGETIETKRMTIK